MYSKTDCVNLYCRQTFRDHSSWKKHADADHPNRPIVYKCSKCFKEFVSLRSVACHFPHCEGNAPDDESCDEEQVLAFPCDYCDMSFTTKIGLGVHCRARHPAAFEETKNVTRVKPQWSDEEVRLLALAEAQLPPETRFVNRALQGIFPNRTIEGIKGIRNKKRSYKLLLEEAKANQSMNIGSPRRVLPSTPNQTLRNRRRTLPSTPTIIPPTEEPIVENNEVTDSNDEFKLALRANAESDETLWSMIEPIISGNENLDTFNNYVAQKLNKPLKSNKRKGNTDTSRYRRRKKVKRYARFQQMFRRNKKNLADMILNDKEEAETFPTEQSIRQTYQTLYESESPLDNAPVVKEKSTSRKLYIPITADEVKHELRIMRKSAPGPDNLTLEHLRALDIKLLLSILNVQLWLRKQLPCLNKNRTRLIPKKSEGLEDASNWRPITLSSMVVRLLHRILAGRISSSIKLNERQKAFVPLDGCAQNTFLLDHLIRSYRKDKKDLFIIGIDLSKAFDSVSRHSIRRGLSRFAVEDELIEYLIDSFNSSTTEICCGESKIEDIRLNRGVKQGDPVSPVLFNIVIDELLDTLPSEVGAHINGIRLNSMAYADDIIIISESKSGMEKLLKTTKDFFDQRSMKINVGKCFSLAFTTTVKDRAPYVIKSSSFKIDNKDIPATSYNDFFKYLGIRFDPNGKMTANINELNAMLERLRKAPLKPYQKIELLRNHLLPKFSHQLVLGRVTKGLLNNFDARIRNFVRETTDLPKDTPTAFFYARTNEGGLGIPCLLFTIPRSILRRMSKMETSNDPVIIEMVKTERFKVLENKCLFLLGKESREEGLKEANRDIFKRYLYDTIDGKPLATFEKNRKGQLWLSGTTSIVSGRNYRQLVKLRIGRLPTLENCNRGREADKKCRRCKRVNETLQHVIQNCPFSHFQRIMRHNSIADLLKQKAEERGHQVLTEPQFRVDNRNLKPDLVIITPDEVAVVDVSIVTEGMMFQHLAETRTLDGAWNFKADYYSCLEDSIRERFNKPVWFGALILSVRGVWCSKNDDTLRKLNIIWTNRELFTVRSMEQSVKIWRYFMHAT